MKNIQLEVAFIFSSIKTPDSTILYLGAAALHRIGGIPHVGRACLHCMAACLVTTVTVPD